MRIISDFQDYYDSAATFGGDSTRIYQRRCITTKLDNRRAPEPWSHLIAHDEEAPVQFSFASETVSRSFAVCFCGSIYWGLQIPDATQGAGPMKMSKYTTSYDSQSAYDAIRQHPVERRRGWPTSFGSDMELRQRLKKYFSSNRSDALTQRLVQDRVAVAILMPGFLRSTLVINARLADVEFFKVVDAWTAFQELDMFWGGVLAPESRPVVTATETDRLLKHGFDRKSFRKAPTKARR